MCQTKNRDLLRNGHAADLATQGHGIADIIDGIGKIENRLTEIPTRFEVREMVQEGLAIHIASCDAARDDARDEKQEKQKEHNRLKVLGGKFGLEAEGKPGILVGLFVGLGVGVGGLLLLLMAKAHVWAWIKSLVSQ